MSEPHITSGATREGKCDCGAIVTQRESHGAYLGKSHWMNNPHDAPCGLPCLGGGIRTKVWSSGQWHKSAERCPACKVGSDPRGES